ncbi:MAG: hypothetical protein ACYDBQ_05520 [Thermoplasmatota archaeon]
MRHECGEEAVGQIVGFLVGGVVFLAAVGTLLVATREAGPGARDAPATVNGLAAASLAQVLMRSPGLSGNGSADWTQSPDSVVRLGLMDPGTGALSLEKFDNLRRAGVASNGTDGLVNYADARHGFGLDRAGLGFHIRTWPEFASLKAVLDAGGRIDTGLRLDYIAHASGPSGVAAAPVVSTPTCTAGAVDGIRTYTLYANVTNGGGAATLFSGTFQVTAEGQTLLAARPADAFPVASGATAAFRLSLPAVESYCDAGAVISFNLTSPGRTWGVTRATLMADITPTSGSVPPYDMRADANASYLSGHAVPVTLSAPGATHPSSAYIGLEVLARSGTALFSSVPVTHLVDSSTYPYSGIPSTLAAGNYTLHIWGYLNPGHTTPVAEAWQPLSIVAAPAAPFSGASVGSGNATLSAQGEASLLEGLVQGFCPYYAGSTTSSPLPGVAPYSLRCGALPGGVYADGQGLGSLPVALAVGPDPLHPGNLHPLHVDALVVGSDVNHTLLSAPALQGAIGNWTRAGGQLMVFGSSPADSSWLKPLFATAVLSSGGGLTTPDVDNPMLHTPYDLAVPSYQAPANAWQVAAAQRSQITQVVQDQAGNDLLAVSDPGSLGMGRVVLTEWTPGHLLAQNVTNAVEARHLAANLVLGCYQDLFLDYGPPLPVDVQVEPAVGLGTVQDPVLGQVTVHYVVYVFPQS